MRCGRHKASEWASFTLWSIMQGEGTSSNPHPQYDEADEWGRGWAEEPVRAMDRTAKSAAKKCAKCGKVKPAGEFGVDRHQADGLNRRCRTCRTSTRANLKAYKPRDDFHRSRYVTPDGKCLMHRRGCTNDAMPGDDLCEECAAYYRQTCQLETVSARVACRNMANLVYEEWA